MKKESLIPDEKMHGGHRARMRRKLLKHGTDIFDTYELLEMLLYHSIPCKDTNPISKRLLSEMGSLDGVLGAEAEKLTAVCGVGERTAELIASVDCLSDALFIEKKDEQSVFCDYDITGAYLARVLADTVDKKILLLLLNNGMRKLDLVTIYENAEYGSMAVKPQDFIRTAILTGASVAITAHNHPYGPLAPSMSDLETNKLLAKAFKSAGIVLLENYVTVGGSYVGTEASSGSFVYTDSEINTFIKSRERSLSASKRRARNDNS